MQLHTKKNTNNISCLYFAVLKFVILLLQGHIVITNLIRPFQTSLRLLRMYANSMCKCI